MPIRLSKHYWIKIQRAFRRVARSTGTADQIAMGAALGVVVGLSPTVGLQMVISASIATLIKVNRIAAILPVWITNPFTIIPIYSFNYWLGRVIVGGPGLKEFEQKMLAVTHPENGISESLSQLAGMGTQMLLALWLGSLIVGFALAIPTYYLVKEAVVDFRKQLHKRRQDRHERVQSVIRGRQDEAAAADADEDATDEDNAQ